ncbi:hypothetical protein BDZ89DRAFT_1134690 [Hymenopellis radicata]|nr:hypothetical protein BDZ89DRAFT_1134690 [Hymenopellis radicata]
MPDKSSRSFVKSSNAKFNTQASAMGFKSKKHPSLVVKDPPPTPTRAVVSTVVSEDRRRGTNRPASKSISSTRSEAESLGPGTPVDGPRDMCYQSLLTLSDADPFPANAVSVPHLANSQLSKSWLHLLLLPLYPEMKERSNLLLNVDLKDHFRRCCAKAVHNRHGKSLFHRKPASKDDVQGFIIYRGPPSSFPANSPRQNRRGSCLGRVLWIVSTVLECGCGVKDEAARKGEWVVGLLNAEALQEFIVVDRQPRGVRLRRGRGGDAQACPVCYSKVTNPMRTHLLQRMFRSQAHDDKPVVPHREIHSRRQQTRDLVRPEQEGHLFQTAFLAYVHARGEEFKYCPAPDCGVVYRSAHEGTDLTCVNPQEQERFHILPNTNTTVRTSATSLAFNDHAFIQEGRAKKIRNAGHTSADYEVKGWEVELVYVCGMTFCLTRLKALR